MYAPDGDEDYSRVVELSAQKAAVHAIKQVRDHSGFSVQRSDVFVSTQNSAPTQWTHTPIFIHCGAGRNKHTHTHTHARTHARTHTHTLNRSRFFGQQIGRKLYLHEYKHFRNIAESTTS